MGKKKTKIVVHDYVHPIPTPVYTQDAVKLYTMMINSNTMGDNTDLIAKREVAMWETRHNPTGIMGVN